MGFSAIFEALGVGVVVVLICLLLRTLFSFILGLRYIEGSGKVVVVTGCDTGFGRGVALKLDKLGFYVIAACLTEAAVKELNSFLRGRGRAIRCDITSANDVREVESVVTSLCTGSLRLHALVNNAGIHEGFAVEFTSVAEYQHVLDVNCLGGIRVTQALLPLLAPNRGRVVNVTSAAAFVSLPLMSAYNVSKFGFTVSD